jgi:hypothetical protein
MLLVVLMQSIFAKCPTSWSVQECPTKTELSAFTHKEWSGYHVLNTISGVNANLNFRDPDTAAEFVEKHCNSIVHDADDPGGTCIGKREAEMVAAYSSDACSVATTFPACVDPDSAVILDYECFTAIYSMLPQSTASTLFDAADALYYACQTQTTEVLSCLSPNLHVVCSSSVQPWLGGDTNACAGKLPCVRWIRMDNSFGNNRSEAERSNACLLVNS